MASADLRKDLECSVCLNVYTDPVMLNCGHNFCRVCIDRVLDTQEGAGRYSCPECREEFQERPALQRNITLRNIMEKLLSPQPNQEIGIRCTYCVDSPVAAVKSCLLCEASLCEKHLRVHSKSPEHVLTDPSTSPGNRKCPEHKKILQYYCTEDAACVCVSCCETGEHRGHQMDELSRKMRHLEELCNLTDPLTVLQEPDTGDLCDPEEEDNEDRDTQEKLLPGGGDLDVPGLSHTLHVAMINRGRTMISASPSFQSFQSDILTQSA